VDVEDVGRALIHRQLVVRALRSQGGGPVVSAAAVPPPLLLVVWRRSLPRSGLLLLVRPVKDASEAPDEAFEGPKHGLVRLDAKLHLDASGAQKDQMSDVRATPLSPSSSWRPLAGAGRTEDADGQRIIVRVRTPSDKLTLLRGLRDDDPHAHRNRPLYRATPSRLASCPPQLSTHLLSDEIGIRLSIRDRNTC